MGVSSVVNGTVDMQRFRIADSSFVGLQLANEGVADLFEGALVRNVIGVNLQTPDFDLDRITNRVFYVDNGRNLDLDMLPVPDIGELPFF